MYVQSEETKSQARLKSQQAHHPTEGTTQRGNFIARENNHHPPTAGKDHYKNHPLELAATVETSCSGRKTTIIIKFIRLVVWLVDL